MQTNNARPFMGVTGKVEGLLVQSDNPLCYVDEDVEVPPYEEVAGGGVQRVEINLGDYTDLNALITAIVSNTIADVDIPENSMAIVYIDNTMADAAVGKSLPANFADPGSEDIGAMIITKITSDVVLNLYQFRTNQFWYCTSGTDHAWIEPYSSINEQKVAYWS